MSPEENKSLAHRFFEEQDRLKGSLAEGLCAPNYTFTLGDDPPVDFHGHEQLAAMFYGAFPDLHQTIEEAVAEDDRVAVPFKGIRNPYWPLYSHSRDGQAHRSFWYGSPPHSRRQGYRSTSPHPIPLLLVLRGW